MPDSARNESFLAESGIRWSRVTPGDLVSSLVVVHCELELESF